MESLFDIPTQAELELRDVFGSDLKRAALEALLIEGYRSGKLSLDQVRRMLGFESRWQTEEWLGARGVPWNYSLEDFDTDRKTLQRLFSAKKP